MGGVREGARRAHHFPSEAGGEQGGNEQNDTDCDRHNSAPACKDVERQHVIKGGSWAQGTVSALRASFRDHGAKARDDVGFRLARYAR